MKNLWLETSAFTKTFRRAAVLVSSLVLAAPAFAQQGNSAGENVVNILQQAFSSTIARGVSLVAIVVSGLTLAFGEGGAKRVFAGTLFGRRNGHRRSELSCLAVVFHRLIMPDGFNREELGANDRRRTVHFETCVLRPMLVGGADSTKTG